MNSQSGAMRSDSKIFVAGHRGMVGSAICRSLRKAGFENLLQADRKSLDLCCQQAVADFFAAEKPEFVFLAAARVGGIHANNSYPGEFLYQNLMIEANVIEQARQCNVQRLLFMGSSCIYPKFAPQPIPEEALLEGALEPTNEAYAIAKIAGIKLCAYAVQQYKKDFRSVMPCNLYGPGDNYHLQHSHVIPAMIRKLHDALHNNLPEIELWGTGKALREFLHVDDLADACLFLINLDRGTYDAALGEAVSHINVGASREISIRDLAEKLRTISGYSGKLRWNTDMPDGTPRKCMNNERIESLGWRPTVSLDEGLEQAWRWYNDNLADARQGGEPQGGKTTHAAG